MMSARQREDAENAMGYSHHVVNIHAEIETSCSHHLMATCWTTLEEEAIVSAQISMKDEGKVTANVGQMGNAYCTKGRRHVR